MRHDFSPAIRRLSRRDVLSALTGGLGLIASRPIAGFAAWDEPGSVEVPGTDLVYYLVPFDENGRERRWKNGTLVSSAVTQHLAGNPITDVFIFSHGWYGDMPAAKEQYSRWLAAMYDCEADRESIRKVRTGFSPLLIGVHWPSAWFGDEELKEAAFAADAANAERGVDQAVDRFATRLANTHRARRALRTIIRAAQGRPRTTLSPEVVGAFKTLESELRIPRQGMGGAPGTDRNPFDPQKTYQAIGRMEGLAGADGAAGGWSVLDILRVFSFWVMKDRARHVGEEGGHRLLLALQNAVPPGRRVRFHLMGHSFGCIVVSATVAGPRNRITASRPVDSLTLVQGAYSLWSCCSSIPYAPGRAGYFRPLVTRRLVNGPIVTTQSSNDRAVCVWYPWAAGLFDQLAYGFPPYGGVGEFGLQGPGFHPVSLEIQNASADYGFEPGKVYNVDSSSVISKIADVVMGAHSDIAHPEVAHIVWQAAVGRPQDEVPLVPPAPPPAPPSPAPRPQPQCRRRRRKRRRRRC